MLGERNPYAAYKVDLLSMDCSSLYNYWWLGSKWLMLEIMYRARLDIQLYEGKSQCIYISQTFNDYFHHVSNAGIEFGLLLKYRSITT